MVFRIKLEGEIPKNGAYIIAANHASFYDPVLVGAFSKRPLAMMAKAELFEHKVLGWLIKKFGAFPVHRNKADITAVKKALSVLKGGDALLIFPEGRRVKKGEASDAKSGMIMFALKTQTPVIPVGINSSYKLFSRMTLKFGQPVYFEEYYGQKLTSSEMEPLANQVLDKIKKLAGE